MLRAAAANEPGAHAMTSSFADDGHDDPAGQTVQFVLRATAIVPTSHSTGLSDVLAHAEPAGQSVQFVWPPSEYVPAAHATGGRAVDGHDQPAAQRMQRVRVFTCGVCVV